VFSANNTARHGFTLVELLVVIAIIAMLVTLLLPAVQAAREAARLTQCTNHIKQLALGGLNHESAHGFLPSNGWGYRWVGDPDLGFGKTQPGGWAFTVLPFIEEESLFRSAVGSADKPARVAHMVSQPVGTFMCPSRRQPQAYPFTKSYTFNNAAATPLVARGDYAGNAGDQPACAQTGPSSVRGAENYAWCGPGAQGWQIGTMPQNWKANGACFQRSEVNSGHIVDGMSKTYLLGERYLNPLNYLDGRDFSDDQCLYQGHDNDVARWTQLPPQRDQAGVASYWNFGSSHAATFQMAMCDGSVHRVDYGIETDIHRMNGNRADN